jgi:hypothetical protein
MKGRKEGRKEGRRGKSRPESDVTAKMAMRRYWLLAGVE